VPVGGCWLVHMSKEEGRGRWKVARVLQVVVAGGEMGRTAAVRESSAREMAPAIDRPGRSSNSAGGGENATAQQLNQATPRAQSSAVLRAG